MTDNEIIKALECCADEMGCKKGCPCFDPKAKGSCCTISKIGIEKIALDLINRQQAEIERLSAESFEHNVTKLFDKYKAHIKSEAVKEVFEKLRTECTERFLVSGDTVIEILNEVEKEMVSDE